MPSMGYIIGLWMDEKKVAMDLGCFKEKDGRGAREGWSDVRWRLDEKPIKGNRIDNAARSN